MKKLFLILLLVPSFLFAQVKVERNVGLDPVTGEPGYVNLDTFRTVYHHSPLYVIGDTVFVDTTGFTGGTGGVWSLNGTKAYYMGYAGLGRNDPRSRFEISTDYNTTVGIDSLGLMLSQKTPSIFGSYKSGPPLIMEVPGWNTTTSASQPSRFRMYAQGASGAGGQYPSVFFGVAKDTVNYVNFLTYQAGFINLFNTLLGTNASFSSTLFATQGVSGNGINIFNNPASGNPGQTMFGKAPATFPSEPAAIVAMYSNGIQGLLIPVLTTAQRDSIGYTVSAVTMTNGGTGYTSAPNVTNTQTYLNGSAPAANGVQSWGGSFFSGTATISGGSVTGVTITHGGYFNGAIKINFSGGGGTGATATATMSRILPEGLLIYNSTLHEAEIWTGTSWTAL